MAKKLCIALVARCRKCELFFEATYTEKICPDCEEPRACKNRPVEGYSVCAFHGGPNPKNNFYGVGRSMTTGSGSSFPLTRLASKFNQMQKDGVHLSNKRSIAIIRRRIEQLAERIDTNQAPDRLKNLQKLWKKYLKQKGQRNPDAHITENLITEEFEKAYHDYMAWEQMMEALKLDSDLVGAEVKIAKDLHAILTAEDAYELVAQIFGIIIAVENDPDKLKRYQYEFTRLVGDGSVIEAEEGD